MEYGVDEVYKLIAFDMDGTLLNEHKVITKEVIEAVRQAKSENVKIVLCSGRSYQGLKQYFEQLGQNVVDYCISFNGALITDVKNEKNLHELSLHEEDIHPIERVSEETGLSVHFVTEKNIYTPNNPIGKYTIHEAYLTNMPLIYSPHSQFAGEVSPYKALLSGEKEEIEQAIEKIPNEILNTYTFVRSGDFYLEVMKKEAGKGNALKYLADVLGIQKEEVVAFGDHENDLSMIQFAGLGIAMANAIDEVKKAAKVVTKSNQENGVAYGLMKWVLKEAKLLPSSF